jgi:hypothetical protein
MTVLQGLIAVGAVAGTFGAAAMFKHENNVGAQALNDLAHDLGDPHNELVEDARNAYQKQKRGRVISTGLTGVAESTNVGFAGVGAMAGGMRAMIPLMGVQMALPKIGELAVPDNAFLNAYVTWQQAEKDGKELPKEEKTEHLRQMVGTMRMVRLKGGYYNHLSGPVAEVLCERNLSLRDSVRVLGNKEAFTQLTVEANAKLQALKEKAANDTHPLAEHDHNAKGESVPHSDKNPIHHHVAANENHPVAANDDQPHLKTAKPGVMVAADRALEGRVDNSRALQSQV